MNTARDNGTTTVLITRFTRFRLPRALELKARIDGGGQLTENDLAFLQQVLSEAHTIQMLVIRDSELQQLVAQIIGLYSVIISKGLENEFNRNG